MRWRVFAIFFIAYLFTAKGYIMVNDTVPSLEAAESIVTRGALDVPASENTYPNKDGLSYSKHGIGLPFAMLPEVVAAHMSVKVAHLPERQLAGFFVSFLNVPFALLTLWTFARLLRRYGVVEPAVTLLTVALGLGTLLWAYAVSDFSECMQSALLLIAFDQVTLVTPKAAFASGAAFAALVLVKLSHAALAPFFVCYLVVCATGTLATRAKHALLFAGPAAAGMAFVFFINYLEYGNPLESGYRHDGTSFSTSQWPMTLPALLVLPSKGVFVFSPVLALGLLGWRSFWKRMPREAALAASLVATNLLFIGAFSFWYGGWCWGPRYLVPLFPLWLLPAGFWLCAPLSRARLALAAAITCISIVAQVPGVLIKEQEIHSIVEKLTPDERAHALGDGPMAWVLFFHKLEGLDETYAVGDLGVPGDRTLDLRGVRTFRGWNTWTAQLAAESHRPVLRWLSPLALFAATVLLARLAAELWASAAGGLGTRKPPGQSPA